MVYSNLDKLPNPFASKTEKDSKEYGVSVCKYIVGATREYVDKRNRQFRENRLLADGKQSLTPILDMANIDGKKTYTNLSLKPSNIAKKFERIVVDGYMEKKREFFKVTALSKHIQDRKDQKKKEALVRMEYKQAIDALSQQVGFPIEDPNEFVPKDKEDADIYFSLNTKEKEELLFEDVLSFVASKLDFESLKRKIISEIFQLNLYGLYEYIDNKGRPAVDFIRGEDCLYGQSYYDDFRDAPYKGRRLRMSVSQLRARFAIDPKDEKKFFEAIKNSYGQYTSGWNGDWSDDYYTSSVRPYDNNIVFVYHVWFKTTKVIEYREGTDRLGREVFDTTYKLGSLKPTQDGRKKVGKVYPETAYEGFFLSDRFFPLEWKEQTSIVKDGFDKGEIVSPFTIFMPDNNGSMNTPSALESIADYIQTMDMCILKIKQIIANTPPDGLMIDVQSLMNLDLGTGSILDPLEITSIYRQTGDFYYKGTDENGNPVQPPLSNTVSDLASKINGFLQVYNFNLSMVRDVLGINEFRDGTASKPRTGFGFAQAQTEASNIATQNMYRGFLKGSERMMKNLGIRIWNALKYGEDISKGLQKFIGDANYEFIKRKDEIVQSIYDFKIELGSSDEEREYLENNIQLALGAGTLYPEDALMIRRTVDTGLAVAERMLTYLTEKRRLQKQEEAQQNLEAQSRYQAESGVAVEKEKQNTAVLEGDAVLAKEKAKAEAERDKNLEALAWDMIRKEQEGIPIPPKYQAIVDSVLQNRGLNVVQQTEVKTQELEAQAMAEEQQAMAMEQMQEAIDNGDITEEQAMQMMQQQPM